MINIIKILELYNDVSRLYILVQLDSSNNDVNLTIPKLQANKISQPLDAVQLTNNLIDIMPDADPIYLDLVGEVYMHNINDLSDFIGDITTKKKAILKYKNTMFKLRI